MNADATRAVEQWLIQRHHLMLEFNRLCTSSQDCSESLCQELRDFSMALIDYVSALQFEILEIIAKAEEDQQHTGERLNSALMIALLRTTNHALSFSDHYHAIALDTLQPAALKKALSDLGEQFAQRLDLEDTLIRIYNEATHFLEKKAAVS